MLPATTSHFAFYYSLMIFVSSAHGMALLGHFKVTFNMLINFHLYKQARTIL